MLDPEKIDYPQGLKAFQRIQDMISITGGSILKKRKLENNCLLRDVFLKIFFFFDWRSANDGFSLIAWRRFSFKRRSKRRLDRRLVSQELIVGLNKETIGPQF